MLTAGTDSFSACADAASVVTARLTRGNMILDLASSRTRGARNALAIMVR